MISKNPEWIEGTKMTTNRKYLKYDALNAEAKELEAKLTAIHAEADELVMAKIRDLQQIGKSVFRKCYPDSSENSDETKRKILGDLSWILDTLQLKGLDSYSMNMARVQYSYENNKGYSWKETSQLTISRSYLHMSDRDFAKLIRQKVRKWKDAQRAETEGKLEAEIKAARATAQTAEKKLQDLEARQAKRVAKISSPKGNPKIRAVA